MVEQEPNSFAASAATLNLGATVVGLLSPPVAWYSVNLTAGSIYEFKLAGSSSGGGTLADPSLTLCYSNGTVLESCDNLAVWSAAAGGQISVPDPQLAFTAPKTGTYDLMVGGNGGTGSFTLSENAYAVPALANDLLLLQGDSIYQGSPNFRWNGGSPLGTPVSISYAFLSASADNEQGFVAMTAAQQQIVRTVLAEYSAVANISFTQTADQAAAQIRFGTSSQSNSSGITWAMENANGDLQRADVFINNTAGNGTAAPATATLYDGGYGLLTLIHEVGHALGLKHPGNYDAVNHLAHGPYLPAALDNEKFSVMSYVRNPDSSSYHDTPGLLDIAAVQTLYGANTSGVGQTHTYTFSNSSPFVGSLLSSGTSDTLDLSNQLVGATVFLTPGTLSSVGVDASGNPAHDNLAIPFGATVLDVVTGPGNDLIVGNTLDNKFFGFSPGDTMDGGGGNDTLVLSATSAGLNSAADSQLANIQTVDARSATTGIVLDLHSQSESIDIELGPGGDTLIGGSGRDVAVLAGNRAAYAFANAGPGNGFSGTVGAATGTDTISNIARFQFADVKLAFDTKGSAGETAKIIGAAFGVDYLSNTPANDALKGLGISIFDAGVTMQQLSAAIVGLDMFVKLEGTNSNADFLNLVFDNIVGRLPTPAEAGSLMKAYFDQGMSQAQVLTMAAELDANVRHIGLVGLAGAGLEYS